jgi:NAD(P)-dependent dehydrogenase (short-subunit alcohol dehydrogenase family)
LRGLSGKAAIVTGASTGIGRGIALRLAEEGVDQVLIAAPEDDTLADTAKEIRGLGRKVVELPVDVGEEASAATAVQAATEQLGRLDYLVNNAGIAPWAPIQEADLSDFDAVMRVNVRGVYLMAVAATRYFVEQGHGAMCFTASVAGVTGEESMAPYNASKAAVGSLARSIALDLAPHRIRVNAVAPGWVRTAATDEIIKTPSEWRKHRARIPFDRAAEPSEIAAAVAFLLSDDASYMTGSIVVVDGGQSAGFRWSGWDATEPDAS